MKQKPTRVRKPKGQPARKSRPAKTRNTVASTSRPSAANRKTLTSGERIVRKPAARGKTRTTGARIVRVPSTARDFEEILHLIQSARHRAYQAANIELIALYWNVGAYVSRKVAGDGWGKGTVQQLSTYIQKRQPGIRGFSPQNIWRMRQFHDAYRDQPKLSALLRELNWTCNLMILSATEVPEGREFYLRLAAREHWSSRDLEHQIKARLFECTVLQPPKLSAVLRELHPAAESHFKDSYLFDFLTLPDSHSEHDLQSGLTTNLRRFLLALGRDFTFVGEQYPIQVGRKDFHLDLLFFHRELQCLIAIELKTGEFHPSHLGQLEFYLEALDRDVRKPHENPSIGVLLCATKDREVVEYALSRSLSPTLIAEYKTKLPDRALLQRKLHEFYEQLALPAPARPSRKKR